MPTEGALTFRFDPVIMTGYYNMYINFTPSKILWFKNYFQEFSSDLRFRLCHNLGCYLAAQWVFLYGMEAMRMARAALTSSTLDLDWKLQLCQSGYSIYSSLIIYYIPIAVFLKVINWWLHRIKLHSYDTDGHDGKEMYLFYHSPSFISGNKLFRTLWYPLQYQPRATEKLSRWKKVINYS